MNRRKFFKTAALGGASATALAAPALSQGREKLTMVTSWPRGLAGVWDSVERVVNNVADMTDGTLEIDAKASGELVGGLQVFDAVSAGQADMYHAADYYFLGQSKALAFFTAVPFGMTAPEFMTWYYAQDGMKLHHELGEIFGLRSFVAGQTGAQGGGWFRNEIKSAEDFQGLKFRMPGLGGEVVAKLGASVQVLPASEIYQALSTGTIDGTEWIGPWSDEKLGLQEVAKHYYPAGFHEPGAALSVSVNLDRFNSLSRAHQRAIEVASADTHQYTYALFMANNGPALQRLVAAGVQTHEFSDDTWDAYGKGAVEVLGEARTDDLFSAIHDSVLSSMTASAGWLSLTDGPYIAQRTRVLDAL
ncbi:MAG: ABC transporter substrate-binding protein [Dinoroseobacter sp.]|nr:ABC transporter substrate-binding protein [Dinoroseobacter sp.]